MTDRYTYTEGSLCHLTANRRNVRGEWNIFISDQSGDVILGCSADRPIRCRVSFDMKTRKYLNKGFHDFINTDTVQCNTVTPRYFAVHLLRFPLCPLRILKFPPKVPHRNRVFNGEEKHTLLDQFTVIPTSQFSHSYCWRYLVPNQLR